MKTNSNRWSTFLLALFAFSVIACEEKVQNKEEQVQESVEVDTWEGNRAYAIGEIALEATARDTERNSPRPTITSRYLGLIFTAVFDAWSRYDESAIPVYLTEIERQAASQRTEENKAIAISYAAFHTLKEYYYADSTYFKEQMNQFGLDPALMSSDPNTPEGIGYLAAKAVIEARKNDGANQYAEVPGSNGMPYFDYSGYFPVNDADQLADLERWQPKYFETAEGERFAPGCLTPFWPQVKPISLDSASEFRPGPPPSLNSPQLIREVEEVVELQAGLTDVQKALVEFMRDGPKSVQQAGHWLLFAQEISRRDENSLDEDVKMYFLNQITAMDAFIASWDSKMHYDFARPYALVHAQFEGDSIQAWAGPEEGMTTILGEEWRPYSPAAFLCPPFPSYVSGHSCVSGACAEALRLLTGSEEFGAEVELVAGALTHPESLGDTVKIVFPTFTETAEMAGFSRVLGGYHIQADNVAGLQLGRDVADKSFAFYQKHLGK
jgi:hypothetical protein